MGFDTTDDKRRSVISHFLNHVPWCKLNDFINLIKPRANPPIFMVSAGWTLVLPENNTDLVLRPKKGGLQPSVIEDLEKASKIVLPELN